MIIGFFIVSNLGLAKDFIYKEPETEAIERVLEIFQERLIIEKPSLVTTVIGETDFLPLNVLQLGIVQGLAVCRIARYFSLENFQKFIYDVEQEAQEWKLTEHFNDEEKVKEIFSIPDLVAEKIFKSKDKKNTNFLQELRKNIDDSLLSKINPIPIGTGFLVGGAHLLTNHHVIPNEEIAQQCVAQFNYVENEKGLTQTSADYEFDPVLFVTEPNLDYTLLQLKTNIFARQAGYQFGWIPLSEADDSICPPILYLKIDSNVDHNSVIQSIKPEITNLYDEGFSVKVDIVAKELVIRIGRLQNSIYNSIYNYNWNNIIQPIINKINKINQIPEKKILELPGALQVFSKPEDSVQICSKSGDPVYIIQHPKGRQKKVVLHDNDISDFGIYKNVLRYVADTDYGSSGSPVFNARWELVALHHAAIPNNNVSEPKIISQQGIRTCRIVEDLKKKSFSNSKLKSFIEDFVITLEELNYPALSSAVEFDGERSYIDFGKDESFNVNNAITIETWVRNNDPTSEGVIVYRGGSFEEPGYCLWRYAKKIRVELQDNSIPQRKIIVDTNNTYLDDEAWHHVAFTWERQAGVKIYIDGEEQDSHFELGSSDSVLGSIDNNSVNLTIGRAGSIEQIIETLFNKIRKDPDNRSIIKEYFYRPNANLRREVARKYYFNGSVAEIRLWGVVRNPEEIKNNMYRRLVEYDHHRLKGYWRLEEADANKVYNLAKTNVATPFSDLDQPEENLPPNFGLRLDGLTDYVDCGKSKIQEIKAITIEVWMKNNDRNSDGMIVNQGGGWKENGYSMWWVLEDHRQDNGRIRIELQNIATNHKIILDVKINEFKEKEWYHISFSWRSKEETNIYINGNKISNNDIFVTGDLTSLSTIGTPEVNLHIGHSQNYGRYFNGSIAEVRIWNVARTEEQIKQNMYRQISKDDLARSNLIGYWKLDEEAGNKAINSVSEQNNDRYRDGLVYGGIWEKTYNLLENNHGTYGVVFGAKSIKASQYPALPLPIGLKFNKSSDRVVCGDKENNYQDLNITEGITSEAWIKHKFGNCLIVSRIDQEKSYSLSWFEGKIRVCLQEKHSSERTVVYTEENFPDDHLWHHVAFAWDNKTKEISVYVNGRLQNCVVEGNCKTILFAGQTKSIGLFKGSLKNLTEALIIGSNEVEKTYYSIVIAEVRLWNEARTQDQIKKNMSRRLTSQDADWSKLLGYWRLDDGGQDNNRAINLKSDKNYGIIQGAQWFPSQQKPSKSRSDLSVANG
ncbi:MAG: LamG-like jellyroll fold domain-containing protein [Nostoc sp.]